MNKIVQYLITTVYECSKDVATDKVNCLEKQTNDALPVLNVSIWRTTTPMTAEEIIKTHKEIVENTNKDLTKEEPLKILYGYPLLQYDEKSLKASHQFTVVHGIVIEQRRHSVDEPVIIQGDTSEDARAKAIEDHLTPYEVAVPFIALFPETDRYMFEIRLAHTPLGAVSEWDSSKHEVDPNLNKEQDIPLAIDPTGLHIDPDQLAKAKAEAEQKK